MPTDSRTRSAGTSSGEPGDAGVRHPSGVLDQRLHAAQRLPEREDADAPAHLERALLAVAQPEGDHAAEAGHLPSGEVVARMLGQAGVEHLRDRGVAGQELDDPLGVCAVTLHPDAERLDAAQHQPRVERPGDRAHRVLVERQLVPQPGCPASPGRRRPRRSGRPGTWWSSARPRRRRDPAAAAGRARRRCCRPPAAPRPGAPRRPAPRCRRCRAAGWSASRTRSPASSAGSRPGRRPGPPVVPACTPGPSSRTLAQPGERCRRTRRRAARCGRPGGRPRATGRPPPPSRWRRPAHASRSRGRRAPLRAPRGWGCRCGCTRSPPAARRRHPACRWRWRRWARRRPRCAGRAPARRGWRWCGSRSRGRPRQVAE